VASGDQASSIVVGLQPNASSCGQPCATMPTIFIRLAGLVAFLFTLAKRLP
jgi:hypothetical protein